MFVCPDFLMTLASQNVGAQRLTDGRSGRRFAPPSGKGSASRYLSERGTLDVPSENPWHTENANTRSLAKASPGMLIQGAGGMQSQKTLGMLVKEAWEW